MTTWIVAAVVVLAIGYGVVLFNRLVKARQMAAEGWSGIDVQLKRRADLVPNLVDTVKGYAAHERTLFEEIARLRTAITAANSGDVGERERLEKSMSGALTKLMALAEAYPDLKASETFRDLQGQLAGLEDEIQMARRYYNGAARNLNVLVETFPSNLLANAFSFGKRDYFEIEEADRQLPGVAFGT